MTKNLACPGTGSGSWRSLSFGRSPRFRLRSPVTALAAMLALSVGLPAGAGDGPESEVLAKQNLKPAGSLRVLESESEFKTKLTDAKKLQRQLSYSIMQQHGTLTPEQYQQYLQNLTNEVNQMRSAINSANTQMAQLPRMRGRLANSYAQEAYDELMLYRNQLTMQVNQESAMLNQLRSQKADPKAKDRIDAEVRDRREAYHQALADLRTLADSTTEKYAEVAKNEEVKKAIETLGKGKRDKPRLGPSHDFLNGVKLLEKFEKAESAAEGAVQEKPSHRSRSKRGPRSKSSAKAAEKPGQ